MKVNLRTHLIEVFPESREALLEHLDTGEQTRCKVTYQALPSSLVILMNQNMTAGQIEIISNLSNFASWKYLRN